MISEHLAFAIFYTFTSVSPSTSCPGVLPPGHCSRCSLYPEFFTLFFHLLLHLMTLFKSQLLQHLPCEAIPNSPGELLCLIHPLWHCQMHCLRLHAWLLLLWEQFESGVLATLISVTPGTSTMPGFRKVCWEWMNEWIHKFYSSSLRRWSHLPLDWVDFHHSDEFTPFPSISLTLGLNSSGQCIHKPGKPQQPTGEFAHLIFSPFLLLAELYFFTCIFSTFSRYFIYLLPFTHILSLSKGSLAGQEIPSPSSGREESQSC